MAFETQIEVKAKPEHAENGALRLSATSDGWLALIAMAILMTIFQIAQGLNSDTSWLLTRLRALAWADRGSMSTFSNPIRRSRC